MSNHRRRRFDVRVVPHRRRSPFRLRDWRMSTKLATVLVVPSVAFLVLAGVQTTTLVGRTTALNDFARQVGIGRADHRGGARAAAGAGPFRRRAG